MRERIIYDVFKFNPNPKVTEEQDKFISDLIRIGQTIEYKEEFKRLLHHLYFKKHIVRPT